MILVSEVKEGMTLRLDDRLHRVLEVIRHTGSGQMHGFVEIKTREMKFGVEEVELTKRYMEYIFADSDACYFMDPVTFEQVGVPRQAIGKVDRILKEGTRVAVELLGEEPVSVQIPKVLELEVASTGPGIRDGQDNTMKMAMLESGIEILVPQFIETGDHVRVDTEKMKYIDRVMLKKV
jgi:elongation factor P